jgi:hypothetical protein
MKAVFFTLLLGNIVAGAWLLLGAPVDVVREPGRMDLQVDPGRLRVLSEAEFARKREQAQSAAAAASAETTGAGANGTNTPPGVAETPAAPQAAPPASQPPAPAAALALPLASCIDIGSFASEAATRKIRTRLASAGLGERSAVLTVNNSTRLHITGVDAAGEAQIHLILHDFPKQEMSHCSEPPAPKPAK